jgi:cytosine/adenosine deaminase-related metal-dependent hydrolase
MSQGHGHPLVGRLRDQGSAPSLGVDLESFSSGEMFTAARVALAHQRALDNAVFRRNAGPGESPIPDTPTLTTMDALRWITVEGARTLGRTDIGSIAPGQRADLVLIDTTMPNMQPVNDPVNTALTQTSLANVDSVMVGGRWRKRHGVLLDDHERPLDPESWLAPLRESAARLTAALG